MKYLSSVLFASALLVPGLAMADNNGSYDQCLMQSLKGNRNSMSSSVIADACGKVYKNGAMLLPRERNYYICLIQNLPGVENDYAVQQISTACRRQNPM